MQRTHQQLSQTLEEDIVSGEKLKDFWGSGSRWEQGNGPAGFKQTSLPKGQYDTLLIISVHTQIGSRPLSWGFFLKGGGTYGQRCMLCTSCFLFVYVPRLNPCPSTFTEHMSPLQVKTHAKKNYCYFIQIVSCVGPLVCSK